MIVVGTPIRHMWVNLLPASSTTAPMNLTMFGWSPTAVAVKFILAFISVSSFSLKPSVNNH